MQEAVNRNVSLSGGMLSVTQVTSIRQHVLFIAIKLTLTIQHNYSIGQGEHSLTLFLRLETLTAT